MSKETLFGDLFAVCADGQVAAVNASVRITEMWERQRSIYNEIFKPTMKTATLPDGKRVRAPGQRTWGMGESKSSRAMKSRRCALESSLA